MPPKTKPAEATPSEVLAEEVNPTDAPENVERPDGAPELRPYHALGRRPKAAVLKAMATLPRMAEGLSTADIAARMYEALADIEDAVRAVAVDRDTADAWMARPGEAADGELMSLFVWYLGQMGEAPASPS